MKRISSILATGLLSLAAIYTSSAQAGGIYIDGGDHNSDYLARLTALGYTYTGFNSYGDASFMNAIANADTIIVGERHNVAGALSASTEAALSAFVAGGGKFIGSSAYSTGSGMDELFNSSFGTSLVYSGIGCSGTISDTLNTAAAAGTTFAGGPATLDDPSCTFSVASSSLPTGALDLYNDGTNTTVFAQDYGSGAYVYLGWDFCVVCSSAADTAAWTSVLDSAIKYNGSNVPAPASIAILGLGLLGFGLRRSKA